MAVTDIASYVEAQFQIGKSPDQVKSQLQQAGWQGSDIDQAIAQWLTQRSSSSTSPSPAHPPAIPPPPSSYKSISPSPPASSLPVSSPTLASTTQKLPPLTPSSPPRPTFVSRLLTPLTLIHYTSVLTGQRRFLAIPAILLVSLIMAIRPSYWLISTLSPIIHNLPEKITSTVEQIIPEELEVTIQNGTASTNVTEPYYITTSKDSIENLFLTNNSSQLDIAPQAQIRLLTIDTQAEAEDFERYQGMALLTQTSLVYYSDDQITIRPLNQVEDITLSRQIILDKINQFNRNNRISTWLTTLLYALPFLIFITAFINEFLGVLVIALFIKIITAINQLSFPFKKIFPYTASIYFPISLAWELQRAVVGLKLFLFLLEFSVILLIFGIAYQGIKFIKHTQSTS